MAIENPNIVSDMVEVSEFPELAEHYQVYGVPLTVANETIRFEGGAPEGYLIPALLQQLGVEIPPSQAQELYNQ